MSYLSAQNICAGYGREDVVKNISFQLENGCLMGMLGANGSGKTTLLKALCGILPHRGTVTLQGEKLEKLSPKKLSQMVSYIPQRSGISIDISVLDVVLMGFNPSLGLLAHPTKKMKETAIRTLARVGLSGKEEENYLHLSEGQKQLCILARTLVAGSKLLLLDEPESALDFHYRYQLLSLLAHWVKAGQRGAIVTLHDPALALNCCDRLLLLKDGEILGTISPREDSLGKMEQMLCQIYGPVSLQTCQNRRGERQIVMLKENADESGNENSVFE